MHTGRIFCLLAVMALVAHTRAQQWDWVQRFQGDASAGTAVGVDAAQNVYLAGTFTGTNYIGAHKLDSAKGDNLFLAKFDSFGAVQWVITAAGSLNKMLVASNGAVFICGQLTLHPPAVFESISGVRLVKVEEGFATPLPVAGDIVAMNFAPDGTLFQVGHDGTTYIQRTTTDGAMISRSDLSPFLPRSTHTVVSSDGNIFVTTSFGRSIDLGTTNLNTGSSYQSFLSLTLGADPTGTVLWAWSAFAPYYSAGQGLTVAPSGDIISSGIAKSYDDTEGFVACHSPAGALRWKYTAKQRKSFYEFSSVATDEGGTIHAFGNARGYAYDPLVRKGLFLVELSADGQRLNSQAMTPVEKGRENSSGDIAATSDGAVIISGTLRGTTYFGSNVVSGAPPEGNAFVARRSSIEPELKVSRDAQRVILTWPRTSFPFVLQQSDSTGTNWTDVLVVPEELGLLKRVVFTGAAENSTFRLTRTNELPIRSVPEIQGFRVNTFAKYLQRTNVLISRPDGTATLAFSAWGEDRDGRDAPYYYRNLDFFWREQRSGSLLGQVRAWPEPNYSGEIRPPYYSVGLSTNAVLPPGVQTVQLEVTDVDFWVTNSITFEVLSFSTALGELGAALEPYATNSWGRLTMKLFGRVEEAVERQKPLLAAERLRRLGKHLQFNKLLTEDDRARCVSAASQLEAVLRAE
jgi:hypothetical protein